MRNAELDIPIDLDKDIGELKKDRTGYFRIINGDKIYQMSETSKEESDLNLIINRERAKTKQ